MALLLSEGKLEQDEICTGQYIKLNCDRIDTKNRCITDHQSQRVLEWAYFYPKNGCSIFLQNVSTRFLTLSLPRRPHFRKLVSSYVLSDRISK
jgi:hypothetical protein